MPKHNDKHVQLEKILLQKAARYHELFDLCRDSEVTCAFDRPIQSGWNRLFRVRADVLRSSEGEKYTLILPHVQNVIWSRRHDFMAKEWGWIGGTRLVDKKISHRPRTIPFDRWEDTGLPDSFRKYFRKKCTGSHTWGTYTHLNWGWGLIREHILEPYVVPRMLTHYTDYTEIHGVYTTERAEISRWMRLHRGWELLSHLRGDPVRDDDWASEGLALKRKAYRHAMEEAIFEALEVPEG